MTYQLQSVPSLCISPAGSLCHGTDIRQLFAMIGGGAIANMQAGTVTLVAGVATVSSGVTITASSQVFVSLATPGGTLGAHWQVPPGSMVVGGPGTGAFTVTAVSSDGATVTTDTSTLNYWIIN